MMRFIIFILSCLSMLSVFAEETPKVPITLPSPQKTPDYVDFYSGPQLNFAIDLDSIVILPTEEKEVRYTLKAVSKQGATNISYEGIRCDTYQKMIYAIGHTDGSWTEVRTPQWKSIQKTGVNLPHTILAHDYFCDGKTIASSVEKMRDQLKWKR